MIYRITLPLFVVLVGALAYSLFWNQFQRPLCESDTVQTEEEIQKTAEKTQETSTSSPSETVNSDKEEGDGDSNAINVYLNSDSTGIIPSEEVEDWLVNARNYLEENPDARIRVVAYKENSFDSEEQLRNKASTVRDILIAEYFQRERVSTMVQSLADSQKDVENKTKITLHLIP